MFGLQNRVFRFWRISRVEFLEQVAEEKRAWRNLVGRKKDARLSWTLLSGTRNAYQERTIISEARAATHWSVANWLVVRRRESSGPLLRDL